ncbi:MAG: response regulator, partial [Defluviitaleaceae bacterium]|nr:response regulator [Defluviitaleaceae bacterium]
MNLPNVLIVDDQPSVCKEVATFLRGRYNVIAFKSGKEALTYLDKNHVDFILLDYYMPEMTGFEVLLQIRQNKSLDDTPAIFLTSEINERMEHEMRQRGANDYLCK